MTAPVPRSPAPARWCWTATLTLIVCAPPAARLVAVERQTFGRELVTLSGLLAVSLLVATVLLVSRLRSVTRAFGVESVLADHRMLGAAVTVTVLVHVAAVILVDPRQVAWLIPLRSVTESPATVAADPVLVPLLGPPARALAGLVAVVCLTAAVVVMARRRGRYDRRRVRHLTLVLAGMVATVVHIVLIGHLVPSADVYRLLTGDPAGTTVVGAALTMNSAGAAMLAGLAVVLAGVLAWRWLIRPLCRGGDYQVVEVRAVSEQVRTIVCRRAGPARARPLAFAPGQFAWLRLRRDPLAADHPFTIASASDAGNRLEFTVAQTGAFTTGPLARVAPGDHVWIDGPHGAFTPEPGTGLVLLCGGVGITPMLSILRTLAADPDPPPVRLVRADPPGAGLFADELAALADRVPLTVHELGRGVAAPDRLAAVLPPPGRNEFFVCGPPAMVDDVCAALAALGVPDCRVRTERFTDR